MPGGSITQKTREALSASLVRIYPIFCSLRYPPKRSGPGAGMTRRSEARGNPCAERPGRNGGTVTPTPPPRFERPPGDVSVSPRTLPPGRWKPFTDTNAGRTELAKSGKALCDRDTYTTKSRGYASPALCFTFALIRSDLRQFSVLFLRIISTASALSTPVITQRTGLDESPVGGGTGLSETCSTAVFDSTLSPFTSVTMHLYT